MGRRASVKKVHRDYDRAELDRNYTQTAWAANQEEIVASTILPPKLDDRFVEP